MSFDVTPEQEKLWARPQLEDAGPIRNAGGFFRTAEGGGSALGGVPLVAAEDAVVAAVRMAYKVADAQLERSARLAERLRKAGDRAVGEGSERKAIDATEQLVFKAMMRAVEWLEAAAERRSPLKRLMAAQYTLIGSMLGLGPTHRSGSFPFEEQPEATSRESASEPSTRDRDPSSISPHRIRIFLSGEVKRAVSLRRWEVAGDALSESVIRFYHVEGRGNAPVEALFSMSDDGRGRLTITPSSSAASGRWRAAVCREDGEQIGIVEIEL